MSSVAAHFAAASTQYLEGPTGGDLALGNSDWTIAGWFWNDTLSGGAMVAKDEDGGGNRSFGIFDNGGGGGGKLDVDTHRSDGQTSTLLSATGVAVNTWNMFVVWYDATAQTINLSLNNATPVSASTGGAIQTGAAKFCVGGRSYSTSHAPFDGRLQNIGVWTKILSESERSRLWNHGDGRFYSELTGSLLTGLVAWYALSETSGTRVDSTGRGNDLTPINTPTSAEGIHQIVRGVAKTSADYIALIKKVKTSYLDGLWYALDGMYEQGGAQFTWLNAYMVQTTAILAGQGEATGTDISRAVAVIALLIASPCRTADFTWTHLMDGSSDKHEAVDQVVSEALYYAWKYRTELGLSGGTISSIASILTVNTTSPIYGGQSLQVASTKDNQNLGKWLLNKLTYAKLAGGSVDSEIATCLTDFIHYMDTAFGTPNTGANALTGLNADWTWRYSETMPWHSLEYSEMSVGAALLYYPDIAAAVGLDAGQIAKMKSWQRTAYGMWQRNGYPNWDTCWSSGRMHLLSYWMWSLRGLLGMVRGSALSQDASTPKYAKWMLDEAINTYLHMDAWNADPWDYANDHLPFNTSDAGIFGSAYNNRKSSSTAKFTMELAVAVDLGIADAASADPGNPWGWDWATYGLHISTPYYSAACNPYAPVSEGSGGADAIQSPGDGISRIQLPTNEILTNMGGYNQQAFSFLIKRGGVTDIDTGDINAGVPTSQDMYIDGALQTRSNYDTQTITPIFANNIRTLTKRTGTNYRSEVLTEFWTDHISSTYSSFLTGSAGTGDVVFSFPCRQNVLIDYVAVGGSTTNVWDGSTVTDAGSPDASACKYIHLKWRKYGAGIILIPKGDGGTVGAGAKVSASGAITPVYPNRQPDQDRTLLIYLASSAASMGDVSWQFDLRITDGSDSDALAVYNAQLFNRAVYFLPDVAMSGGFAAMGLGA